MYRVFWYSITQHNGTVLIKDKCFWNKMRNLIVSYGLYFFADTSIMSRAGTSKRLI